MIEVRTGAPAVDMRTATLDIDFGSDALRELSAVAGASLEPGLGASIGLSGQGSRRFLDPVHPDNLHNAGGTLSATGQFAWTPSPGTSVTVMAGFGGSRFDVPHGAEQEAAGQDQRQDVRQQYQTLSWQLGSSPRTVSQVAAYHRLGSSSLLGSPADTPLRTDAHRRLRRGGLLASLTHHRGRHLFKLGAEIASLGLREDFSFVVTDPEGAKRADLSDAALQYTSGRPFVFRDRARPTLVSAYAQDSVRVLGQLTLDLGVRADWSRMLSTAFQASPRIGASYHWPATQTTLRASVGRFFQPPQAENLLLASSAQARELSPFNDDPRGGGADLAPERQTAYEVGVAQVFPTFGRLDVAYWRRHARHVADPNVFFGTTAIFPNAVARGRASGVDVRVEVPRRRGWSAYASYTNSRVVQFGPITGGLFLEEALLDIGPGTAFTPDHDQRHVGAFGVVFDSNPAGLSAAATGRYESGTPLEVEDDALEDRRDRPGADLVDFDRGRVKPRLVFDLRLTRRLHSTRHADVTLRLTALNLTGRRWAYNFGNPFSGTHFGPGRSVQVGLRVLFRSN